VPGVYARPLMPPIAPVASDRSFHRVTDGGKLLGYVAIDSTVAGRARGGLRMVEQLCEDEIRAAARAMTLKYGLLDLPQGGAKAGIIGDGEAPPVERQRLLLDFARAAAPLLHDRRYVPDADLGTTAHDVRWMMQALGATVRPRDWQTNRSGEHTARSVLASAMAVRTRQRGTLDGCRVAIEGFGKVGTALARLLHERGARVVAISTSRGAVHRPEGLDVPRLLTRAGEVGSRVVEDEPGAIARGALLELPVDLLFPCARFQSIHAGNVARVAATAICAGANDPVSPEAEAVLVRRGVAYPPDFVSNCGGVLGGTLEFAGAGFDAIGALIEVQVQQIVRDLMARAERQGVAPRALAESDALARHAAVREAAEHPTLAQRLVAVGVECHRRQWVPEKVVGWLATRWVARRLQPDGARSA
jgi:glutamate dehydrogenase (NAD(P)+)